MYLVQALWLCTGCTAHRKSSGIALLFLDHGTRRTWGGQRHALVVLYPRESPIMHCTGGWKGPRAGLDRYGKSRLHRDSIPGPSSPYPVAIRTTLPCPHNRMIQIYKITTEKHNCFILVFSLLFIWIYAGDSYIRPRETVDNKWKDKKFTYNRLLPPLFIMRRHPYLQALSGKK